MRRVKERPNSLRQPLVRTSVAVATTLAVGLTIGTTVADGAPPPATTRPRGWPDCAESSDRVGHAVQGRERLQVFSAAMEREVVVDLQRPYDLARPARPGQKVRLKARPGKRPTIYFLDGAEARETESGWYSETRLADLASKTDVNVDTGRRPHSYTDWQAPRRMGNKKFMWETFLTRELPAAACSALDPTGWRRSPAHRWADSLRWPSRPDSPHVHRGRRIQRLRQHLQPGEPVPHPVGHQPRRRELRSTCGASSPTRRGAH